VSARPPPAFGLLVASCQLLVAPVDYYRLVANEADVVERAQRGDLQAFNQLVETYSDRVYTHCNYVLRNSDNAADVSQEAFIKAWRNIGSLRGAFKPWLMTIATNACRDFLRAQKPTESLTPDDPMDARPDPPAKELGPEGEIVLSELQSEVRAAIDKLPAEQREVIVSCDLLEMDYSETATSLGIPIGTVKSRLFRAREAMRQLLTREQLYGLARPGGES
jgi:RNA polymerase sigma factor (sigma-70 family)